MHVVQISFFVDPERRPPSRLLEDWFALADVAQAVASAGAKVTVVQASMETGRIERSGVTYHFVAPDRKRRLLTTTVRFRALLHDLSADVYHVHGLGFAQEVMGLRDLSPRVPILLQDHADRLPRVWKRGAWRRAFAAAAGLSFCARAQAEPFQRAGLLGRDVPVFEIPESTSSFMPGDQARARAATGLRGNPAVLWVGHLNRNKDPLTVLDGIGQTARELPDLQLWCCYGSAPLLPAVRNRIERDPELLNRVHLLGRVPHDRIELLMQAADLFVLGSHREGSSFSLIEALATGLTPVAADIPSVRVLSDNGTIGRLWQPGNSAALVEALRVAAAGLGPTERTRVRSDFEARLSSTAIGRRFVAAYGRLARADATADTGTEPAWR